MRKGPHRSAALVRQEKAFREHRRPSHTARRPLRTANDLRGGVAVVGRAITELPGVVPSPAVGRAARCLSAHVRPAHTDLSEVDAADHLLGPWNDRVRHDTDPELTFVTPWIQGVTCAGCAARRSEMCRMRRASWHRCLHTFTGKRAKPSSGITERGFHLGKQGAEVLHPPTLTHERGGGIRRKADHDAPRADECREGCIFDEP